MSWNGFFRRKELNDARNAIMNNDFNGFILAISGDIEQRDWLGRTLLMECVIHAKLPFISELITRNADANAEDIQGWTALHFAAQNHDVETAKLLLANGANSNTQDAAGNTPLGRAVFSCKGRHEFVQLMLEYGGNPDQKNKAGISPRMLADSVGNFDLSKLFTCPDKQA